MKRFKNESLAKLSRLLGNEPVQHGEHPPSDKQLARSHPQGCRCSHCQSLEPVEQNNDNNALWESSILNENLD